MKTNKFYFLWVFTLLILSKGLGQTEEETKCLPNLNAVLLYLTSGIPLPSEYKQSLTDMVGSCIEEQNKEARFVKGLMQWKKYLDGSRDADAFENVQYAAIQGDPEAAFFLGVFYKDGIGTMQDYNRSFNWFKTAADVGNDKAEYAVGYFYLKGIIVEQDYQEAVAWFTKSDFVMAKHYLGICNFFGYGVSKDEAKGLQLLGETNIQNSDLLLDFLNNGEHIYTPDETVVPDMDYTESYVDNIDLTSLYTAYEGKLIEYDWSGSEIKRSTPISLTLEYDKGEQLISYSFTFQNITYKGFTNSINTPVFSDDYFIDLKKLYPDDPENETLNHFINYTTFTFRNKNGQTYLTAFLDSFIQDYNKEPGAPLQMVFRKTSDAEPIFQPEEPFSISAFPNPFKNSVTVEYDLKRPANVDIEITNQSGTLGPIKVDSVSLPVGTYTETVPTWWMPRGVYFLTMTVNEPDGTSKRYVYQMIKE